jgi:hypothetical protein
MDDAEDSDVLGLADLRIDLCSPRDWLLPVTPIRPPEIIHPLFDFRSDKFFKLLQVYSWLLKRKGYPRRFLGLPVPAGGIGAKGIFLQILKNSNERV